MFRRIYEENDGLNEELSTRIVDAMFNGIGDALARGQRVELRGFGIFEAKARDAHIGRNPRTGAIVDVAAKRLPKFRAGKEIRDRLNS